MEDTMTNILRALSRKLLRNKKNLIKIMLVIIILSLALVLRITNSNATEVIPNEIEAGDAADVSSVEEVLYVDIGGAILNPGVYKVERETRLYEVIEMAGGLTSNADTNAINRAAYVEDGEKIIVPEIIAELNWKNNDSQISGNPSSVMGASLININTASKEELKKLSGIGDVIAEKIIEYRTKKRFRKPEDIMSVNGIGEKMFEKIKEDITV